MISNDQVKALVNAMYQFLTDHTTTPDDGMVVLSNLVAYIILNTAKDGIPKVVIDMHVDRIKSILKANGITTELILQ